MLDTVFALDGSNYRACQQIFRGSDNREYYSGDCWIEPGLVIDARVERRSVGTSTILRLRTRTAMRFRRTWSHIRDDGIDVMVLWFVRRGRLHVSRRTGSDTARRGDFLLTRSADPFAMDCRPDEHGQLDVLHAVIPTSIFQALIHHDIGPGLHLPAQGRLFALGERILGDLLDDDGDLPEHLAPELLECALRLLASAIDSDERRVPPRPKLSELHTKDILKSIEAHLSDPRLSVRFVARLCRISPRYVCLLLAEHGLEYSSLVWSKRLALARSLLAHSAADAQPISSIAYQAGFKSPAHFSRMFKKHYSMSPIEYRSRLLRAGDRSLDVPN